MSLGDEFRDKRLSVGLSQQQVADAAGISTLTYLRVEHGRLMTLSVTNACRVAAVLGLDLAYPGANPIRDVASLAKLERVLAEVREPLFYRMEVVLPQVAERPREQRAWDAMLFGRGRRTGIELETRLRDAQALERRMNLKRRDDPVEAFLLLVVNTRHNRALLREHADLFSDLTRLTFRELVRLLRSGQHPPSCVVLV